MYNEWKMVTIGSLGKIVTGMTPGTKNKENYGNDFLFLTPSDDMEQRFVGETKRKLSSVGVKIVQNKVLPKNSISISCIGSQLGKVVITKKETVTNQQINSIIPYDNVDYMFLYYSMLIAGKKLNYLSKTSTAVPIINKTEFSEFEILLPPLSEQKLIANILSSFDNKIENNNAIIANLEEQALVIFKSWFVDFEPFQDVEFVDSELGRKPINWQVKNLEDMATYKNGLAMQKYRPKTEQDSLPVLKIKELRANQTDSSSDRCSKDIPKEVLIRNGDIIFSWSGSLLVEIWTGGIAGLNQHLFKVTSDKYHKWFNYYWTKFFLKQFVAIARDRATTMGHIKRSHLKDAKILVPDELTLDKMNKVMDPIVSKRINIGIQNKKLEELRDTLLPKLMSGEIRVEEAIEMK